LARPKRVEVEVGGRKLSLSNLDKVMYPKTGFTKGQLIDYYTRIAPAVLPHLKDRFLTMKRYPNGVEDKFFYEKNRPSHAPDWVKGAPGPGGPEYVIANGLPTLVWLANMADLELHTSLSKHQNMKRPTMMVFDLDPGPRTGLAECSKVALRLRELLADMDLECFPKTSGSKGMQVYVPVNAPRITYERTKPLARAIAQLLETQTPKEVTSVMAKEKRRGRVFIDWSQNDQHKTTVCVYSLRARERPTASTPLRWEEVEKGDPDKLVFEAGELLERVEGHGDLFEPVLKLKQKLPEL
jgi:bifunctional non-homologous end joining protein LigD